MSRQLNDSSRYPCRTYDLLNHRFLSGFTETCVNFLLWNGLQTQSLSQQLVTSITDRPLQNQWASFVRQMVLQFYEINYNFFPKSLHIALYNYVPEKKEIPGKFYLDFFCTIFNVYDACSHKFLPFCSSGNPRETSKTYIVWNSSRVFLINSSLVNYHTLGTRIFICSYMASGIGII